MSKRGGGEVARQRNIRRQRRSEEEARDRRRQRARLRRGRGRTKVQMWSKKETERRGGAEEMNSLVSALFAVEDLLCQTRLLPNRFTQDTES